MKKFIKFAIGLVVLGGVLVVVTVTAVGMFWLGPLVKKAIEQEGPRALGAEVKVEAVSIQLLRGAIRVDGLVVGNPKGFSQPSALEVGKFQLNMPIASLREDKIVIDEILIDRPVVTYEKIGSKTNLKVLQQQVEGFSKDVAGGEPKAGGQAHEPKPQKKVVIKRLLITNGVVHAKLGKLPVVTLELPTIERTNIGEESRGGATIGEAAEEVLGSLTQGATGTVGNAGDLLKDAGGKVFGDLLKKR